MFYHIKNLKKQRAREQNYQLFIRSLRVRRGDRIAITGPSGCGKSTTLDLLGLALSPDEASGFLFAPRDTELDILRLWRTNRLDALAAIRLRYMGYVLQTGGLLPFLPVAENMILTASMAGMSREEALENAANLARQLGIGHLMHAMPSTLSVGERQRVAIVRALAPQPALILADEPTAALDPLHAGRVMEAFLRAVEEQAATLIMVTHNADWAASGGLVELPFTMRPAGNGVLAILDDAPLYAEAGAQGDSGAGLKK